MTLGLLSPSPLTTRACYKHQQTIFHFKIENMSYLGDIHRITKWKSAAFALLVLNVFLYFIVIAIAAWAVNHGIERSRETASQLSTPARLFPIYYPFGNVATGFVIIFSLLAGVVGFTTSITGINSVIQWNAPSLQAAAASSLVTWLLTLLAMGLACKEIDVRWIDSNLRTLETMLIMLSGTQLFCTAAIYVGVEDISARAKILI